MKVAAKGTRALSWAASSRSRSLRTRSTLLSASSGGGVRPSSLTTMRSTSSSMPLAASTTSSTMSASPAPPHAASTIARSRRRFGAKMPGVSMKTSWLAPTMAMPRRVVRVVCTLRLTMATLVPTRVLTRVDLPALGAPMIATKPQRVSASGAAPGSAGWADIGAPLPHTLARQEGGGGRLLGRTLARPLPAGRLAALYPHLGREGGSVVRPLAVDLDVGRQLQALALHPLLQERLGVGRLGRRAAEPRRPVSPHHVTRRLVARLKEDGAKHGFARVGEDCLLVAPAALGLGVAEHQEWPQIQL